jgi:hypothetical protein
VEKYRMTLARFNSILLISRFKSALLDDLSVYRHKFAQMGFLVCCKMPSRKLIRPEMGPDSDRPYQIRLGRPTIRPEVRSMTARADIALPAWIVPPHLLIASQGEF